MSKLQKYNRKQKYQFDQFWAVHYTEIFTDKTERDYKAIIKARSADYAKDILIKKTKDDNPNHLLNNIQVYMFQPGGSLNNLILTIEDWDHIHKASFPNVANVLFKHYIPRPEGWLTRTNSKKPKFSNKNAFKKSNKAHTCELSREEKAYMKWDGKWKPWPVTERNALKQRIQMALKMFGNNRSQAAKHLRMHVRYLYKLMHDKFIEVDWTKEFPPPVVSIVDQKTDFKKRNESIKKSWVKRSEKLQKLRGPKILALHHKGYNLTSIHRELGHSKKFIKKVIENENSN
jgi:hypothetical protein